MPYVKNTAVTGYAFAMYRAADSAPLTSGVVSGFVTLDGGTQTAIAGTPVHEGNGQWTVNLTAAEMNGDVVGLVFTAASCKNTDVTIHTISAGLASSISSSLSLADYKSYARITVTTYDDQITFLLAAVQKQVERFIGKSLTYATYTELLDGEESDLVMVKNAPISAVTSVRILRSVDDDPVALDSTAYAVDDDGETGIIRYQPSLASGFFEPSYANAGSARFGVAPFFPRGFRNVEVVYTGGYGGAGPALPADIKLAIFRMIDSLLEQAGRDPTINSEHLGSYEYYNGQIADVFKFHHGVLKPYRSRRLAI